MTRLDIAAHLLGQASLIVMAGVAAWTIVASVAPQWRRIVSLALGNVEPERPPVPRRASRGPHPRRIPQLRAVEADTQLTGQVRS